MTLIADPGELLADGNVSPSVKRLLVKVLTQASIDLNNEAINLPEFEWGEARDRCTALDMIVKRVTSVTFT